MSEGFVLDTPEQIQAFRYLATLRGLELELKVKERGWPPTACPTRGRALDSARRILDDHKVQGTFRTRKQALAGMHQLCLDLGLIQEETT